MRFHELIDRTSTVMGFFCDLDAEWNVTNTEPNRSTNDGWIGGWACIILLNNSFVCCDNLGLGCRILSMRIVKIDNDRLSHHSQGMFGFWSGMPRTIAAKLTDHEFPSS